MKNKMLKMPNISSSKRAQIAGQIFIYIAALIVVGVIALIAYRSIAGIMSAGCDLGKTDFDKTIVSDIDKYNSYGSVNYDALAAPCKKADRLCFVDARAVEAGFRLEEAGCSNFQIRDSVKAKVRTNVFLVSSKGEMTTVGYSSVLSIAENDDYKTNCTCVKQRNGKFSLVFLGKGATTLVMEAPPR